MTIMPSINDFKYFKPCDFCEGTKGARSPKELESKKYCSVKCAANQRKSKKSHSEKMTDQVNRQYKLMNGNPKQYIKHLLQKPERKNLSLDYLMGLLEAQKGLCKISKEPMTFIKIRGIPKVLTNLSIDRIDSSRPYEEGNIQLVCTIVNIMKNELSMDDFKSWIIKIKDNMEVEYP